MNDRIDEGTIIGYYLGLGMLRRVVPIPPAIRCWENVAQSGAPPLAGLRVNVVNVGSWALGRLFVTLLINVAQRAPLRLMPAFRN